MKTDNIRKRHKAHSIYLSKAIDILQQRGEIEFPISLEVFTSLSSSLESIFTGILNCVDELNLYACSILYRSLIEHFYKGFILMNELVKNKSDEASEHYQQHLFVAEFIAEQMGALESEDIISGNNIKPDVLKYILEKYPSIEIEKENQREISAATKKFSFREIIKKLHLDFSNEFANKPVADFFTKMLPEYSRFSTFVHGGPYAQKISKNLTNNGLDDELYRLSEISLTMLCTIKEQLIMCFRLSREEATPILTTLCNLRAENDN